ncbi:MAG: methyltransferase domain-containing protein [Anaerolineales bacterium]
MKEFNKYAIEGAYHWEQTDPHSPRFNAPLLARYQAVVAHVPATTHSILDAGCGDGYLLHLLRQHTRLAGFDYNHLGVTLAAARLPGSQLSVASIYTMPYADKSFDTIVHADVIEHLADPQQALHEMARVAQQCVIISTPHANPNRPIPPEHETEFSLGALHALLKPYFSEIKIYGYWHSAFMKLWKTPRGRRYLAALARRGINVFALNVRNPTTRYEQLVAVCRP